MQELSKYRYFIDGKEIDTREEYFNTTMSGDYVSFFDNESVFSVSFNSVFGENVDNNKMIKREVNSHVSDVLDLGQVKGSSTRHKSQNGETHPEKEALSEYRKTHYILHSENLLGQNSVQFFKNKEQLIDYVERNKKYFKSYLVSYQGKSVYLEIVENNLHNSPRHKSQNGETHKELTVEEKLKIAEGFKKEALKQLNITLEDIKTQSSQSYYTSQEQKEKIKADWIDFIGCGMKRGRTINYENSAEKTEKEENTVFPKDSEIHKEELPPFTTNYTDDYFKRLIDIYTGNGQRPETFTVGEGVNEGIKESNGKTDYSEINLEILDLMAERFTANKHKYPQGNMKKPIDIKSLEWALFRHVKKMIQPIETDEESYKDHLSAVLCNASMILDQLKNNG